MKYILVITLLFTQFFHAISQNALWIDKPETAMRIAEGRKLFPLRYRTAALNIDGMRTVLDAAPDEKNTAPVFSKLFLEIPAPDGSMDTFRLVEYVMMEPGLAHRYPDIRTYHGIHIYDAFKTIRCDWTVRGFSAMVSSREGKYFVEPYARGGLEDYMIFYKPDYPAPSEPFSCGTESSSADIMDFPKRVSGDCTFRSYRLAVATTGEYSNYFDAESVDDEEIVLSEVVIAVNRVNDPYERDITVRLILINNTTEVFYYNPSTDPFSGSTCSRRSQNQTNMTNEIGSSNYDVGHLFGGNGGGGCAALGVICSNSTKAYGVTDLSSPENDVFYIDYVAHELGHQFGGNHTQNNSCNRNNNTAMEPGSASTIMGYAGVCDPNIQSNSDDYFHGISVLEMNNYISSGGGNNCDLPISWNNDPPVLTSGADYTIPKSTPFALTAIATDPEGDPMTYCWEQWDNEVGSMPPSSTNSIGPMFRSLDPNPSPIRYFPRLQDVINNIVPTWEVLPSIGREMEFRVTVRDFHNGMAGCTDEDNINVNTAANAGPFLVTNPNNSSVVWTEASTQTVTWNVANTTSSPVSCANVHILLSYDGGFTYPVTLASNVPNDGSQSITVPLGTTVSARVIIKGANHVFYDISNQNFEIRCGLTVTSIADSGNGSLRQVLTCASAGDTIRFAASMNNATILLLTPIDFTLDVNLLSTPAQNITLDGSLTLRPIYIDPPLEVSIAGLNIIGGFGPFGCAILIDGDLLLKDVTVSAGPICDKGLVVNMGSFVLDGDCDIME